MIGFTNPLLEISETWKDTRLNASFESIMMSMQHPYLNYLFLKNSNPLINSNDPNKVLQADSRIVGLRAGIRMNPSQSYDNNVRVAYSRLEEEVTMMMPLYLIKLSEVDFLRAEGALRGWNMNGSAQYFYNRGLDFAYLEDRTIGSEYLDELDN